MNGATAGPYGAKTAPYWRPRRTGDRARGVFHAPCRAPRAGAFWCCSPPAVVPRSPAASFQCTLTRAQSCCITLARSLIAPQGTQPTSKSKNKSHHLRPSQSRMHFRSAPRRSSSWRRPQEVQTTRPRVESRQAGRPNPRSPCSSTECRACRSRWPRWIRVLSTGSSLTAKRGGWCRRRLARVDARHRRRCTDGVRVPSALVRAPRAVQLLARRALAQQLQLARRRSLW